jgi:hypothetical protein
VLVFWVFVKEYIKITHKRLRMAIEKITDEEQKQYLGRR